jgi:hypothetical protein
MKRSLTIISLSLLPLFGCGKETQTQDRPLNPSTSEAREEQKTAEIPEAEMEIPTPPQPAATASADSDETRVELLDHGGLSRVALRYAFTPGQNATIVTEEDITYHVEWNKKPVSESEVYAIKSIVDFKVEETGKDGVVEISFLLREHSNKTKKKNQKGEALDFWSRSSKKVKELQGSKGVFYVDALGRFVLGEVDIPGQKPGQVHPWQKEALLLILTTLVVRLPEEPVGVGARWKITSPIKMPDFQYTQNSLIQLLEMEGSSLKMSVNNVGHAFSQELDVDPKDKKYYDRAFLDSVYLSTKENRSIDLTALTLDTQAENEIKLSMSVDKGQKTLGFAVRGAGTVVSFVMQGAK